MFTLTAHITTQTQPDVILHLSRIQLAHLVLLCVDSSYDPIEIGELKTGLQNTLMQANDLRPQ